MTFELKVPPPLVVIGLGALMYGLTRLLPSLSWHVPGGRATAASLVVLGLVITLAGVLAFRSHGTTVNPLHPDATTAVVQSGIYRITRNPMYLGMLLVLVGWALYLGNLAAVVVVPFFIAYINAFQITPEERTLLAKFGPPFAEYMRNTRRWI